MKKTRFNVFAFLTNTKEERNELKGHFISYTKTFKKTKTYMPSRIKVEAK